MSTSDTGDRSWTKLTKRFCKEYVQGVNQFIKVAEKHAGSSDRIRCPCQHCKNMCFRQKVILRKHLLFNGIEEDYTRWEYHGESSSSTLHNENVSTNEVEDDHDDIPMMLEDLQRASFMENNTEDMANNTGSSSQAREEEGFNRLLNDANLALYPGCKDYSKLSFIMKMLHNKIITNASIKNFEMNLKLFKSALPDGETLPSSYYEVKKMLRDLGLGYVKIHACPNDCILFWKEYESLDACPNCQASRWIYSSHKRKNIPRKVLRHFPLKPRLQRLFASKDIAEDMRWHKEKRVQDEFIRHPADANEWQNFDQENAWFAEDPRNVRLGLASDGFNPYGNMSTTHSMWPVFIIPYNLPPWRCMKEPFILMSLLIPGKESPGNNIDVYLQPLVEELKDLWTEGIETYDAYSGEKFQLHAMLLWTINDFPAYAMLSGWSTKGKLACPICNKETCSIYLKNGKKQCYMEHRRFLDSNHPYRKSKKFNGHPEYRLRPKELSGEDVLGQLLNLDENLRFGKNLNSRKRKRVESELNWKKKSIFFKLPYWRSLKLRHNLDVMHIEKNVGENIFCTLLNIEGKTKDNIQARYDLEEMGIKKELHVRRDGKKIIVPHPCYTLTSREIKKFGQWLRSVKLPDGFGSNLARCVNDEGKLSGLKSHDYHVLIQRLLPVIAHGFLRKDVYTVLSELSSFFKQLCSRTVQRTKLIQLKKDIVLILCKLEMIYPPSFFVIMVHLTVHLVDEVELGGPVHYRWMYFIERFLCTLKSFVRNKARPEGSIAEAYIDKECLNFCSLYFHDVETRYNRRERNFDDGITHEFDGFSIFKQQTRHLGAAKYEVLSGSDFKKMQWYVLNNCTEVESYLSEHKEELERENPSNVEQRHKDEFIPWFKRKVIRMRSDGLIDDKHPLYILGSGPDFRVAKYSGVIVNGVRFHTVEHDKRLVTQNSGIMVKGLHDFKEIDFYGAITDIIEMDYNMFNSIVMFKCDWWNVGDSRNGIKVDGHLISVHTGRKWYKDDPFVLASQGELVFYVNDIKKGADWRVVQKAECRSLYDIPSSGQGEEASRNNEPYQQNQTYDDGSEVEVTHDLVDLVLTRDDVQLEGINPNIAPPRRNDMDDNENEESDEDDDTLGEYYDLNNEDDCGDGDGGGGDEYDHDDDDDDDDDGDS